METADSKYPDHQQKSIIDERISLPSGLTNHDEIINFDNLRKNVTEKLKLENWIVVTSQLNLYIFNLNEKSNGNLSIRNTISIDIESTAKVFGKINDDILFTLKLYRWSQLQTLIEQLSDSVKREDDFNCECFTETQVSPDGVPHYGSDQNNGINRREEDVLFEFCAINAQPSTEFLDTKETDTVNKVSDTLLKVKSELTSPIEPESISIEHFPCSECDKTFDQNARLMIHKRIHQSHTCRVCNETFTGLMDRHMEQHFPKVSYQCHICGVEYKKRSGLKKHMQLKHFSDEEFYCDICKDTRNFESKSSIEFHMKIRHSSNGKNVEHFQMEWVRAVKERIRKQYDVDSETIEAKKVKKCTVCEKEFLTQKQFFEHMKLHETKKLKYCSICKKYLKSCLSSHMNRVHNKVKNYICDSCGRAFADQCALKEHITVKHTAGESLSCEICRNGQVFRSRAYLRKHLAAHARAALKKTDTQDSKGIVYECDRCNEKFTSKYILKSHTTLQHSTTQYKCNICDKKFGIRSALTVHLKLHSGNIHTCNLCGQSFNHPNYLNKHMNKHKTPPQKKPCTMCDKQYANGFDLRMHMKKIHNLIVQPIRVGNKIVNKIVS